MAIYRLCYGRTGPFLYLGSLCYNGKLRSNAMLSVVYTGFRNGVSRCLRGFPLYGPETAGADLDGADGASVRFPIREPIQDNRNGHPSADRDSIRADSRDGRSGAGFPFFCLSGFYIGGFCDTGVFCRFCRFFAIMFCYFRIRPAFL